MFDKLLVFGIAFAGVVMMILGAAAIIYGFIGWTFVDIFLGFLLGAASILLGGTVLQYALFEA